jgi:glycosyltransferase involved in cell wall biosynthesis
MSATAEPIVNVRAVQERTAEPEWPRITLVTSVYNGEHYLEETILSVLQQRYPNLEYIIVDGGSTDHTAEIIKRYEEHLASWFSTSNEGLYASLNMGFARSSGEIMGWLNASDKLHTNGLFAVGSVFAAFPDVQWITGRPTVFNDQGMTVKVQDLPHWSRPRFLAGANKHIQQESTFWRRGLWQRSGGCLSTSCRAAGDFELWVRFFRYARLYSVDALIAGWRFHPNSLSHANLDQYNQRCDTIVAQELSCTPGYRPLKALARINRMVKRIPKVRGIWQRMVTNHLSWCLYHLAGPDWAPTIESKGDKWVLRRK